MSDRSLAREALQPKSFVFDKENAAWAKTRIALYPKGRQQSAVIPLLMRVQDQENWISRAAIEKIADMLKMPYIRVLEVATFYTQFQLKPVGTRAHIQVCGTTPCMLRGAEDLRAVCQKKINANAHQTNANGTLSWEEVECLGACVNAPMVAIRHDTYEDLTPERLEEIIDEFEAGRGDKVKTGPQNGRDFSAPITGQTTLLDLPQIKIKPNGAAKPAAKKQTPKKSVAKPSVVKKQPAKQPATGKPAKGALFVAPSGAADDLKMISGVGPVLEKKLNAFGVTQFKQVAKFTKKEIVDLDDALSFKGRIDRDEWVKQAKALAIGPDEYFKVFGKTPSVKKASVKTPSVKKSK
ncbi:MAG: NADH-quinone oxidoreductase subunit NuoE [Devosiaceae bacterium]|nr:NADH-quinone oxidoreductase subunit NuoE [Devosiaceae bacterium]